MISTTEAEAMIRNSLQPLPPVQLPLAEAAGLTLAADVRAQADVPAFPQSSMDGYAFSYEGWHAHGMLEVEGVVAAGEGAVPACAPGKAVRIFTGAAVPPGADTVVMQEKTKVVDGRLLIEDSQLRPGTNVRPRGSEIRQGEQALARGSRLSPAAVGFLAGIGTSQVTVFPRPSVSLVITGNELQPPGRPLAYGQVYESNAATLTAALRQWGIRAIGVQQVPDNPDALAHALQQALETSNLVLLTGGVSVGDYDFVPGAAERCGITTLFHKIKQRPGKPLYFGLKGGQPVFGLPGNPSSVLTCYYRYVLPALALLCPKDTGLRTVQAPLASQVTKAAGLTHFLKGHFDGQAAHPLGAQESYRMRSFAEANCLIQLAEAATVCPEGMVVPVHLLPL